MEKVTEVTKQKVFDKNLFLKCFIFLLIGLFIPFFSKNEESLLIVLPYVSMCFYLGGLELFGALIGILCGSFMFSYATLINAVLLLVFYFLFLVISNIFHLKMKGKLIITTFISDLFLRIFIMNNLSFVFNLDSLIFSFSISLITYMLLYYSSSFLSSKKFIHPYFLAFAGGIVCFFCLLIPNINNLNISNILCLIVAIVVSVVGGVGVGILNCVVFAISSYLYLGELNYVFVFIGLVSSFLSAIFNKSKPSLLLVNLLGALFVIYICDYDVKNYYLLIEFLASFLLVMLIPTRQINRLKKKFLTHTDIFEYQEIKYRRIHEKIGQRIYKIAEAYENLKEIVGNNEKEDIEQKRVALIFNDLCKLCPKNKACHVDKSNKLEILAKDILHRNLNFDERVYLEDNCLKPSNFVNEGILQRAYYECEIKHDFEQSKLKQAMIDNLNGISSSLSTLKKEFENETGILVNGMEKNISILLEQMRIEPIFVNYKEEHLNETFIEVGIKSNDKHSVVDLIRTRLEEYLHKPLKTIKIKSMPYENVIRISYSGFKNYHISFGVAQLSKDELYCGDSYTSFSYNNEKYFVISDGMGYGKEAHYESKSTIDSFRQIVETGVKPSVAIKTINSILKLRHKKEFFSTLDILKINEIDNIASITKTCAPSTFLFRNEDIKEIDSYALPVGIVDDVEAYDTLIDIKKGDIFVMSSDGFKLSKEELKEFLKENSTLSSQTLTEKLISYYKNDTINDDVTLFIIKVI